LTERGKATAERVDAPVDIGGVERGFNTEHDVAGLVVVAELATAQGTLHAMREARGARDITEERGVGGVFI